MGAEEGFGGEVVGELAFVPEGQAAVINPALDVDPAAVGFVNHGVEERFAEGLAGIGRGLVAVEPFEADRFDEELVVEAFEDLGERVDKVVFDDLVKAEVGIVFDESPEADADTGVEAERVFAKEDDGGAFEAAVFGEAEFFHQLGDWEFVRAGHAVGLAGIREKADHGGGGEVVECGAFLNDGIPCKPAFAKEEFVEGGAGELHGHAAAAVVIPSAQGDRDGGWLDADFDEVVPVSGNQVDGQGDPQMLGDLLRKLFEEFPGVGQTDGHAVVIAPENEATALGVRKTAEGLQVVVLPGGLPLDGLVFGHGIYRDLE